MPIMNESQSDSVEILIDGQLFRVPSDVTVAAALLNIGVRAFRTSVTGAPRAPLCGMGICFECRVTIDGVPHRRSCLVRVADRMEIVTDSPANS